ncbi:class I SAM-dependent methyltransferase [Pontibacter roseus]|uniref:class I SAM-dependent methyltransferase n=1 Tax=Pontibacter roseus TaxID=336989 RepID=UPI0003746052|nr:class I SAM-dependent methyltransferase [Pontibacter roseus]
MDIQEAYNQWAAQYDSNQNRTRDLEAVALREALVSVRFDSCLEIGCGTGKNTVWLASKAQQVTAVDFSEEMLAKAKEKVSSERVRFVQADITGGWTFVEQQYDLVTFSLVLEHIEQLDHVFVEAANALKPGGHVYLGELHPFKQYAGTKARFETEAGRQELICYTHHISDFLQSARKHGLTLVELKEYFDDGDRSQLPRILTFLLRKEV